METNSSRRFWTDGLMKTMSRWRDLSAGINAAKALRTGIQFNLNKSLLDTVGQVVRRLSRSVLVRNTLAELCRRKPK
jgi:hypothetical protein